MWLRADFRQATQCLHRQRFGRDERQGDGGGIGIGIGCSPASVPASNQDVCEQCLLAAAQKGAAFLGR
ncbi:hypothetical protein ACFQS6_04735 [Xanthomonas populi]